MLELCNNKKHFLMMVSSMDCVKDQVIRYYLTQETKKKKTSKQKKPKEKQQKKTQNYTKTSTKQGSVMTKYNGKANTTKTIIGLSKSKAWRWKVRMRVTMP